MRPHIHTAAPKYESSKLCKKIVFSYVVFRIFFENQPFTNHIIYANSIISRTILTWSAASIKIHAYASYQSIIEPIRRSKHKKLFIFFIHLRVTENCLIIIIANFHNAYTRFIQAQVLNDELRSKTYE